MNLIPQSWPHLHILASVFPSFGLLGVLGFYIAGLVKDDPGTRRTCLVLLVILGLLPVPFYLSDMASMAALTGNARLAAGALGIHLDGLMSIVALAMTGFAALLALLLSPSKGGADADALLVVLGLALGTLIVLVVVDGWAITHHVLEAAAITGFVTALTFFVVALVIDNDLMKQGSLILFAICAILGISAYMTGAASILALPQPPNPDIANAAINAHRDMALWTLVGLALTGGASWLELWRSRYAERFSGLSLTLVVMFAVVTLAIMTDVLPAEQTPGMTATLKSFISSNTWFVVWQIVHFFGYCLIFGAAFAMVLRAFGYWKEVSFAAVHRLLVLGFIGVLLNVFSGMLLTLHDGYRSVTDDHVFALKLALITIGAIAALYFSASDRLWKLRPGDDAPVDAKWAAVIVFAAWAGAIVCGLWGSPSLLTIHVLAAALVIGLIVIIHLRLLGLFDAIAYTSLRRLFPVLWAGFAVQLLSGAALWVPTATPYTVDVAFVLKVVLVVAGLVLTLVLHRATMRKAVSWAADTEAPRRFAFVVPSLVVWGAVVILSWLSFPGALMPPGEALQAQPLSQQPQVPPSSHTVQVPPPREAVQAPPDQTPQVPPPSQAVQAPPDQAPQVPPATTSVTDVPPSPSPDAPPATADAPAVPQRLGQLKSQRKETHEGDRTVITEANRTIIREGGHQIIRHDPVDRFRLTAKEVNVEQRGNLTVTSALQPDGVRVVTEVDESGRLIRRIRRDATGNEVILIDNSFDQRSSGIAGFLQLPPPVIQIAPQLYIRDVAGATAEDVALTLTTPPVEPIERRYSLDEILSNESLRARMPRVDIDTVNFETGSWEISTDQADRLALVAQGILNAVKQNPAEMFLVEGYTDAVGNDVDNLSLSDRRAESVAIMLTSQFGVPTENLTTQGYGKQFLKVPTDGPERANRRVAVRRITPLLNGGQN